MPLSIGLDFGTTNTVVTLTEADGEVRTVRFSHGGDEFDAFRSVLCFSQGEEGTSARINVSAGPWAIGTFAEKAGECRLIQSFKTFAASPHFNDTVIYNRRMRFEDLLATFLREVQDHAGFRFPKSIVVGRPVAFAGASPDEGLARSRYEAALRDVGFDDIHHVYEPVAAAFYFAQRLASDATLLVADFGGGTSDFSIVKFTRKSSGLDYAPLAHTGVGVAGDAFDYRIIDEVVAPAFGKGSEFMSWGKRLPVPNSYFRKFARWNELSLMRQSREYRELQELAGASLDPARIQAFLAFLEADGGYDMYRAVSDAKSGLSSSEEVRFSLHTPGAAIERMIHREEFETWIEPELQEINACVDRCLDQAGLKAAGIDRIFLTGGSSFVPAVRRLFEKRFGAGRIETGDQLVSIANGLSLIAREPDVDRWAV